MRNVLVTGAGGSIGSVLCERLISEGVERLTLVSLTESGLYNIERKLRALRSDTELVSVLGNVCDRDLMEEVCHGVDTVIHAAAHKHVPICEKNPLAAIENNVRGTLTLAGVAGKSGVETFILVSSDKAVRPSSVMGATKRAAEMVIAACSQKYDTRFCTVRFGNVLDSAGSVLPLWREQIAKGGPITLTDERCTRYFMSIHEACDLILSVVRMKSKSGTYVFDMGEPQRMADIAERLILSSGMGCGIEYIGLRPGEKLTEELHFGGDLIPTATPKVSRVQEHSEQWRYVLLSDLLNLSKVRDKHGALEALQEMTCADFRLASKPIPSVSLAMPILLPAGGLAKAS
jgi:FlaA1/EpsC-like NDP-sugar epimerase